VYIVPSFHWRRDNGAALCDEDQGVEDCAASAGVSAGWRLDGRLPNFTGRQGDKDSGVGAEVEMGCRTAAEKERRSKRKMQWVAVSCGSVLVEARLLGSVGFTLQHWAVGFRYKCAVLGPGIGGRLPEFGGAYSP
jgi:hypothetical protein